MAIHFPLNAKYGTVIDAKARVIIRANRVTETTPLAPAERDSMITLITLLLNDAVRKGDSDSFLPNAYFITQFMAQDIIQSGTTLAGVMEDGSWEWVEVWNSDHHYAIFCNDPESFSTKELIEAAK